MQDISDSTMGLGAPEPFCGRVDDTDATGIGFAPHARGMRFMFIDFNAYFASVEQYDEPALRGRPVIVTPLASEHSGAIAASYEAKALGISRGTSVIEARKLCPTIAVRPARHDRYVAVHHLLMKEIEQHLPIQRICSIDECVCRLDLTEMDIMTAKAKAYAVKQGLFRRFGTALRCSIGLAPSSLLAKLASDLQKPDGLTVIEARRLPHSLKDLPLRAIPGIGRGVEERLNRAGIHDFLSLWQLAPKEARAIWGSVTGERFIYGLKGYDVPDLPEAKKAMIGHSRVLSGVHRKPYGARIVARALLIKAASRLRHYGLYAGGLHVSVRLYPRGRFGRDVRFRRTQNSWRFLEEFEQLWADIMHHKKTHHGHHTSLKLVSIHLFGLDGRPPERDLFVSEAQDKKDRQQADLWRAIDILNQRYGMQKIILASQKGLDLNYLGVKIAFSRVPEAAEFADAGGIEKITGGVEHKHASRSKNTARSLY